jgi:DNA-binding transcriptional regulator WhiA
MAKRWTKLEETIKRNELENLYIGENKTIGEISIILYLGQSTVYDRLLRLKIKPLRSRKIKFNNKRSDVVIPIKYSKSLAEFIGIMLGDGHLTRNQITVTLGNKEINYVGYVAKLIESLFKIRPKILRLKYGYSVVYFGSVDVVRWLVSMGLTFNKVKKQVGVPIWIFSKKTYSSGFLKGFFDTDGSIYKLKYGVQLSFTNRSLPLLKAAQNRLTYLGFSPSKISEFKIYLTKRREIDCFFKKINPANKKHSKRYNILCKSWDG